MTVKHLAAKKLQLVAVIEKFSASEMQNLIFICELMYKTYPYRGYYLIRDVLMPLSVARTGRFED